MGHLWWLKGHQLMTDGLPVMSYGSPLMSDGLPVMSYGSPLMNDGSPVMTDGSPLMTDGHHWWLMGHQWQIKWLITRGDDGILPDDLITFDDWWLTSNDWWGHHWWLMGHEWQIKGLITRGDDQWWWNTTSGFINNTYEKAASVSMECTYLFQTHNLQQYTENMNMMK